ncbi:LVIVD repeat-containing protein [Terriglobus sp. RCC_193]|uniref:LVIVD repeat-containing protein n=1 Tax=Terriglobus sp. RCC_193 TaxID=3239218 RepID=UPI0035233083
MKTRILWNTAALTLALLTGTAAAIAQVAMPAKPTVYNNPQLPNDPRVGLKGGVTDAGVAAQGMELVLNLPKPPGFAAGTTPQEKAPAPVPAAPAPLGPDGKPRQRALQLGSTNSDLAFKDHYVVVGNYNGFNIYDIADPTKTTLKTSVMCPGSQGDPTIYGNLLFISVESTSARVDCGTQGIPLPAGYVAPTPAPRPAGAPGGGRSPRAPEPPSQDRFRGVRIFDISDIANPKQLPGVQTCRGSHTNTLVTDPNDKDNVYIYVAGYAPIRSSEELPGCSAGGVDDPNTALYTIVVIQVPLAHPDTAKVIESPRIFSDPNTGAMNGLAVGNLHGEGAAAQPVSGCHDITAFPEIGLAAGACTRVGILLDIKNPAHPTRIAAISDPNFSFWHSALWNNDGSKLIFDDEWGGGSQPRCRATDPMTWGADSIFTRKDAELTLGSYYKMPAPQTELENCTAHNGNLVPIPGRDIEVKSWYQGGISIMDFTDATHPFEIAYFDRGPLDGEKFIDGGTWSSYWYNGYVYGAEIARGLDVYKLTPTKFVTANEIAAAEQIHLSLYNAQLASKTIYPRTFITAKAYVDQLVRSNALTQDKATALDAAMDKKNTRVLRTYAATFKKNSAKASPGDATRMTALAEILAQ